jgi:hypothetical protein
MAECVVFINIELDTEEKKAKYFFHKYVCRWMLDKLSRFNLCICIHEESLCIEYVFLAERGGNALEESHRRTLRLSMGNKGSRWC